MENNNKKFDGTGALGVLLFGIYWVLIALFIKHFFIKGLLFSVVFAPFILFILSVLIVLTIFFIRLFFK